MSHKQVEQHRRMKAKQYFEELRAMLPSGVDSRSDRNKVLSVSIDYLKELLGKGAGSRSSGTCSGADDDDGLMFEMDDAVKLSHNVVEQRRRHMARGYFDELRALLPHAQAAKFDKNTVLLHTVALIRQLQAGLSTASSDNEDGHSTKGSGERGHTKHLLSSSLDSGSLSNSPNDVVSFTVSNFSTRSRSSGDFRRSRKRLTGEVKEESPEEDDQTSGRDGEDEMEAEEQSNKRSRVVPKCGGCGQCDGCDNTWEERAAFEALSLLSECAYQLSQPNTPQLLPSAGLSQSLPSTFTL